LAGARSHNFARFSSQWCTAQIKQPPASSRPNDRWNVYFMSALLSALPSALDQIDGLCAQISLAMANAEWRIYLTIAVIVVLSYLLLPFKNDPDRP
jgi:hypothetical protein